MFEGLRKRERDGHFPRDSQLFYGCIWPASDEESMDIMQARFHFPKNLKLSLQDVSIVPVRISMHDPKFQTHALESSTLIRVYRDEDENICALWHAPDFHPKPDEVWHASLDFEIHSSRITGTWSIIRYKQISLSSGGLVFSPKGNDLCEVKRFTGKRLRK